MADRETIITTGDSGGGIVAGIVIVLLLALFGYFLFFNRPGAPEAVTVDVPAVTITTPNG